MATTHFPLIDQRLAAECGRIPKQAPFGIALAYPSPYRVGMSSLGYQRIYAAIQAAPGMYCERAFLPDDLDAPSTGLSAGSESPFSRRDNDEVSRQDDDARRNGASSRSHNDASRRGDAGSRSRHSDPCATRRSGGEPVVTYESKVPLDQFPVIAISVAYELELAGLIHLLEASGIPALREERDAPGAGGDRGASSSGYRSASGERGAAGDYPFILVGGPLTFSNPLPVAPFADAIVMGEAEGVAVEALQILVGSDSKATARARLARLPGVFVPDIHGDAMGELARSDDALLPATSPIRTPHAELSNMFLIEAERGCSRACAYCVMRRGTGRGMRIVPAERILSLIPDDAPKVGLVGAAVSDHPQIVEIVRTLAERGKGVGLSSLRPDRLKDEFVGALRAAGYKTLTTAMDGPSERLREQLVRRAHVHQLERAAELARLHGMQRLKLYLMVGLPGEEDSDIDECSRFVVELSRRIPVSLGIAPFCAKRNTPLDGQPFAGISTVKSRLDRLRRGLRGRAEVRPSSVRWAWVEYVLAQGGQAEGRAVYRALLAGGGFGAFRAAFEDLGWSTEGGTPTLAPTGTPAGAPPAPQPSPTGCRSLPVLNPST